MEKKYFKAFIRVVKSLNYNEYANAEPNQYMSQNIIEERLIEADNKDEVKKYLLNKYPQFFQVGKVYEKETKDTAQFFYAVIYPLFAWEVNLLNSGEWVCASCGHIHPNKYISRPRIEERLFKDLLFCRGDNDHSCLEDYKRKQFSNVDFPDDTAFIRHDSLNYIYKITEKSTNKCYVGKTRNAPFFRWWNHLTHSSSPFGLYLKNSILSDWTFEVLEVLPAETPDAEIFRIESEYIQKYDSINNGFNSLISCKSVLNKDVKYFNVGKTRLETEIRQTKLWNETF